MRQPISFAWRNLVFGRNARDAWGLFRVHTSSYAGLPVTAKRDLLAGFAGFAAGARADFQILRVSRAWSVDSYADSAAALADLEHAQRDAYAEQLGLHADALRHGSTWRPEVYLAVRLSSPRGTSPLAEVARIFGLSDPAGLTHRALQELLVAEERIFEHAGDYLDCERASSSELQWLLRRAFCRGLSEPQLDERWRPQALVLDADEAEARRRYVPLETDVVRLTDAPINIGARGLRIEDEAGTSHQALLTLGALPETVGFPSRQSELLFAPLESLPFAVDAVVGAQWIANDRAVALTRRRVIDADHAYADESLGDHGPSASGAERPAAARELEEYLTAPQRPPLLRATIGLCISAPDEEELERRVEQVRREYAPVTLHRPLGSQLELFISHLPAQTCRVRSYDDVLLCEQLGAMVPTATHAVGPEIGLYIGHTLSGSAQPVLFDIGEGSRTSRPPAVLCSGTLGSGKTVTALLLAYLAHLAGSRVVTVDPKGDHRLDALVGHDLVERIELRPGAQDRGLLDPLRVGSEDTRAELAYGFLLDTLPSPVPPRWQTELRAAVDEVVGRGGRACGQVLDVLETGDQDAQDAARAIRVHSASGLLQLGFADDARPLPEPGDRPVCCLRIANLTLPLPGTPRSELTSDERAGQALLRLLASYALHLMGGDWSRHKVLVFDEAWMLLDDAAGRALVQRINRLCRSQNATPILATQQLSDVAELEPLLGAQFCFGVETDAEASKTLRLLGLDGDDERLRSQLRAFRAGRCFMRDYEGRVAPIQIDPVDPALLDALDTRPVHE